MQKRKMGVPKYISVSKKGPDNSPLFTESVYILDNEVAKGCGKSKKLAQQVCAKVAYEKLVLADSKNANKKQQKPVKSGAKKVVKDNKTKGKR